MMLQMPKKGAVKVNKKHSALDDVDPFIFESESEQGEYYLFLTDTVPTKSELAKFQADMVSKCIWNYRVICASTKKYVPGDVDKVALFFRTTASNWMDYLERNGKHCQFVTTFGYALFGVTKSSDIVPEDFYCADYMKYYIYLGNTEVGNYNSFFLPVESFGACYPTNEKHPESWRNWTTRMFLDHLDKARTQGLQLPDMTPYKIEIIETKEDAIKCLMSHMGADAVAWDTETSSLNPWKGKLVCLTLCFDGITGYFIPWNLVPKVLFARMLASIKTTIVGANGKFDQKWVWANGVNARCFTDDIMILSHFVNTERHKGLKPQSFYYTFFGGYDYPLDLYKEAHPNTTYDKIPTSILAPYATIDAISTMRCFRAVLAECRHLDAVLPNVQQKMEGWSIERFYRTIAMPTQNLYCKVEYDGIYIDIDRLKTNRKVLDDEAQKCRENMAKIWNVPKTFDFTSVEKLGKLLEERGYPEVNRSKKGILQTDEDSLAEWTRLGLPGISELVKFRGILSCRNTFLGYTDYTNLEVKEKGWEQFIVEHEDGSFRIHAGFDVFGTGTLRFKVSDPNTQNLPTHNEFAGLVKECFGVPVAAYFTITDNSGKVHEGWWNEMVDIGKGEQKFKDVRNMDVESIVKVLKPTGYHGLETCDFGSLQARIATIDTSLNPQGIDPALYELYKVDSPLGSDMHSMTAFNVFCKPFNSQVVEAVDDTGKKWTIGDLSNVKVTRDGSEKSFVGFKDLKESDTIISVN